MLIITIKSNMKHIYKWVERQGSKGSTLIGPQASKKRPDFRDENSNTSGDQWTQLQKKYLKNV